MRKTVSEREKVGRLVRKRDTYVCKKREIRIEREREKVAKIEKE